MEMVVVVDVLVLGAHFFSILPDDSDNKKRLFAFEALHAPQRVWANDDAKANMNPMLVTLDTSHLETSPLNDVA